MTNTLTDPYPCPPCKRGACESCMGPDHDPDYNPWRCPCNSGGRCRRPLTPQPFEDGFDFGIPEVSR